MVCDAVGVLGFIAVTMSLHFQASSIYADGLTASGIVRAILCGASRPASHYANLKYGGVFVADGAVIAPVMSV